MTPSIVTVLDRAYAGDAIYSPRDIALIEPIANAVAPVVPAAERTLRQSLGSLAASMPAAATDEISGRLKLNTYMTMLEGCDERALAYACRRCLEELDWFPTIQQLKQRMAMYVSPEQHAINLARHIVRCGRREPPEEGSVEPLSLAEIRRLSPELISLGLKVGAITEEQVAEATAEQNEIHDEREAG
ncbi:hypothetical protein [Sphingomonas leidyi]|uniref:hypothetical protein n=1 Tax=Sphingomonas leidyi TaxID=68569 RepID=UPI0036D3C089